jgi:hypothetical protein
VISSKENQSNSSFEVSAQRQQRNEHCFFDVRLNTELLGLHTNRINMISFIALNVYSTEGGKKSDTGGE